ncbi:MAG: exodeoxyribonuclease III [Proteobacteria bacterium]|nr:exodeoxyribonuclease III [Pseudomonadota bacterium]
MRIATWNVNSLRVRLPQVLAWLAASPVDVLAMQETKVTDPDFPREAFEAIGYHVLHSGQKTYNGVALLSREPATGAVTEIPGFEDPSRRVLAATTAGVRVVNLYVPNGQAVGSEKYDYKLRWLAALTGWLAAELHADSPLVVLGDFNIAPADEDVHDPAAWEGSVHVSEPERRALRGLLALGLTDVFRRFPQPAGSFSWWDYRTGAFRRNNGLRIDLLLTTAALAQRCSACTIDREPRKAERPSDHTPVIADFG